MHWANSVIGTSMKEHVTVFLFFSHFTTFHLFSGDCLKETIANRMVSIYKEKGVYVLMAIEGCWFKT